MIVLRDPQPGDNLDASLTMYPSRLEIVTDQQVIADSSRTTFGYVISGHADVRTPKLTIAASEESYFCVPGEFEINASGLVVLICRFGFRGLHSAGFLEDVGRLSYIDGCSSTILVSPPRLGDPVFNHLHIPHGVVQTPHTHPSIRLGIVARGAGVARGRSVAKGDEWVEPLTEGCVFLLPAQEIHSFHTSEGDQRMDVLTYHPDSDWGPTDGEHPMKTRTHFSSPR